MLKNLLILLITIAAVAGCSSNIILTKRSPAEIEHDCVGLVKRFITNEKSAQVQSNILKPITPTPARIQFNLSTTAAMRTDSINTIRAIDSMLTGHLKIPDKINLEISQKGNDAWFDYLYTIKYPYQFVTDDGLSKHPKFSQAILAHEYGHMLFSNNISSEIEEIKTFEEASSLVLNLRRDLNIEMETYENLFIKKSLAKKAGRSDESIFSELINKQEDRIDIVSAQIDSTLNQINVSPVSKISYLSYHELFADIVAVQNSSNPEVMKNVLYYSGEKYEKMMGTNYKNDHRSRNFKNRIRVNEWISDEPHALFAPTRSFIWKQILSRQENMKSKGETTGKLFEIIRNEITSRLSEENNLKPLSPIEMNKRLIFRLQQEFNLI